MDIMIFIYLILQIKLNVVQPYIIILKISTIKIKINSIIIYYVYKMVIILY